MDKKEDRAQALPENFGDGAAEERKKYRPVLLWLWGEMIKTGSSGADL